MMLPNTIVPGADGSALPCGITVIRLVNEPKMGNLSPEAVRRVEAGLALPAFFELSTADKNEAIPRLSVWVDGLTTLQQAWVLVGANPTRRWVLFLSVDTILTIPAVPPLDVQWERAMHIPDNGPRTPEFRSGWEGHAGIANLDSGNKTQRAFFRSALSEIAKVQILSLDDLNPIVP